MGGWRCEISSWFLVLEWYISIEAAENYQELRTKNQEHLSKEGCPANPGQTGGAKTFTAGSGKQGGGCAYMGTENRHLSPIPYYLAVVYGRDNSTRPR